MPTEPDHTATVSSLVNLFMTDPDLKPDMLVLIQTQDGDVHRITGASVTCTGVRLQVEKLLFPGDRTN